MLLLWPHRSTLSVCRHLHQLMDMPLRAPAMLPMCMETRAVSAAQNAAVSARLSESVGAEIGDVAQHQHQLGGLALQCIIVSVGFRQTPSLPCCKHWGHRTAPAAAWWVGMLCIATQPGQKQPHCELPWRLEGHGTASTAAGGPSCCQSLVLCN